MDYDLDGKACIDTEAKQCNKKLHIREFVRIITVITRIKNNSGKLI